MIRSVAVPLIDDFAMFEFGVVCEVFGLDRSYAGLEPFDFRVCTIHPESPVGSPVGVTVTAPYGLEAMDGADLIAIPAATVRDEYPEEFLDALRRAYDRGAILLSVCSGAFALGAAGLLDGRDCTTHWRYGDLLSQLYPEAKVCADVLYCRDGNVLTGAGSAAGIDASLHLMREQFGAKAATATARRIVVPPHRDGGQAQFIANAVPDCEAETLGPLLEWIVQNLGEDLGVETLARRSHMSARTFARRFRAETGTTPHSWVTKQRVQAAEELLERTDHSVDWIADEVGFGNAATLRHHFGRVRGLSPQQYRRRFAG